MPTMPSTTIPAIDVHGHYGPYRRDGHPLLNDFMTGDGETGILDLLVVLESWGSCL